MNLSEKYYLENLYPLQDGVMRIIRKLNTPFFLTGGTALSRHYLNHRYSDDLDLFVNSDGLYSQYVDKILALLYTAESSESIIVDREKTRRFLHSTQLFVSDPSVPEVELKVDLINDVALHYGKFEEHPALGKIDSWQNILSNKLCALFRFEPKDVVDIRALSRNRFFSWKNLINEAKSKEVGVESDVVANLLYSFPIEHLGLIRWIRKPDFGQIRKDLNQIADDIFFGRENSLFIG